MFSATGAAQVIEADLCWATSRSDLLAVALVGSWARCTPGPASDLDLVLVAENPERLRQDTSWLESIPWPVDVQPVERWKGVDYGWVWSRQVQLAGGAEVELGLALCRWATDRPVDPGTRAVLAAGWQCRWDPHGLLAELGRAAGTPPSANWPPN